MLKRQYYLPVTVVLELVWVLQSLEYTREEILAALTHAFGLANVTPQHPESVFRAVEW